MTSAYPLQWPQAWPRTQRPERHWSLSRQLLANQQELMYQLTKLGATHIVVSSNVQRRQDGLPYARQPEPMDSGVAVYFTLAGEQQCIPCDKWDTVAQNLRAVALTVEALRGLERWGAKEMVTAAFRGFKALPASIELGPATARAWHEVLEVSPTASSEVIRAAYKRLAFMHHPDQGGTPGKFEELQRAYEQSGVEQ